LKSTDDDDDDDDDAMDDAMDDDDDDDDDGTPGNPGSRARGKMTPSGRSIG